MLKSIEVENFKAFQGFNIQIKPITILIGPNNGGKSSILQSIGLLKQTIESGTDEILNFKRDIDLGNFSTICSQHAEEKFLRFKFIFEESGIYFDVKIRSSINDIEIDEFSIFDGELGFKLTNIKTKENEKYKFDFTLLPVRKQKFESLNKFLNSIEIHRDNFLFNISFQIEKGNPDWEELLDALFEEKSKHKNSNSYNNKNNSAFENLNLILQMQNNVNKLNRLIKSKIRNIRYIGPLRDKSKRFYDNAFSDEVGYSGERTVPIMLNNKKIFDLTSDLLKKMEVIEDISVSKQDNEKIILKFKTKNIKEEVNFADVGCGFSQVLPVIIESIQSTSDSLLLIEQPETHIHPKFLLQITDFIVDTYTQQTENNNRKKIILETHSIYILERIRTHLLEGKLKRNDINIYYIEPKENGFGSCIEEILIESDGRLTNIPKSFPSNFIVDESMRQLKSLLKEKNI